MTTMHEAYKAAVAKQVCKPLMERVWLIVKDRPNVLARELPSILREDSSSVSSVVSNMRRRGMLLAEPETGRRGRGGKLSNHLRVNPRMSEYELWPDPGPEKTRTRPATSPTEEVCVQKAPTSPTKDALRIDLDSMTIKQARELYQQLHKFFGEKP